MEQNINLFSKQTRFEKVPKHLLDDLKFKKFFELKDLENLFPDARVFIIKGKKNIGKTYTMLKRMEEIVKKDEKFLFLRLSDSEVKSVISEWKQSQNIPFTVKSKIIYDKKDMKKGIGLISDVNNTQKLRSLQYEGYTHLFFDEFVPYNNINLNNDLVDNIIRLIMDVQRNKPDLKVWCFGNNETDADIFNTYFMIDFSYPFWYDKDAKTVICNLQDYYEGGEKGIGYGLSYYSDTLRNYLNTNTPIKDMSLIASLIHNDYLVRYSLCLNNNHYLFLQEMYQTPEGVRFRKKFHFKKVSYTISNKYKMIVFKKEDYIKNSKSVLFKDQQKLLLFNQYQNLIKKKLLTFDSEFTQEQIITYISINLY